MSLCGWPQGVCDNDDDHDDDDSLLGLLSLSFSVGVCVRVSVPGMTNILQLLSGYKCLPDCACVCLCMSVCAVKL